MQQLNSKNFDFVDVYIRDFTVAHRLTAQKGVLLMDYLTNGKETAKHVKITDVTGEIVVVRTTDILKILPIIKTEGIEKYV